MEPTMAKPQQQNVKNKKIKFDDIFETIRGMGPYQIILFSFACIMSFLSAQAVQMNFVGGEMEHWCKIPELQEFPFDQQKYIAIPEELDEEDEEVVYSNCDYYDLPYGNYTMEDFLSWNRTLQEANGTGIRSCENWVYDQSEFLSTMSSMWDTVCGESWLVQLSSSLYMAGVLFGVLSAGFISDRFGRRPTFFLYITLKIGACLMSALAPLYPIHSVARFFMGFGSGGSYMTFFVIVMELVGPKHRTWTGVVMQMSFSFGFMAISGMAYFLRDQRDLQLAYAVPMCIMLLYVFCGHSFLPESPRWLLIRGRFKEAEDLLHHIATINGRKLPESFTVDDIEAEGNENQHRGTVADIFKSSVLRKRTLIIYLHWFTDSLIFYALSLNTGALAGDIYLNTFISGAVEVPANLLCWFLLNNRHVGRRLTCGMSLILAGLCSLIQVPLILTANVGIATTVCAQLGKACVAAGFTSIYVYSSELFPTEVRSSGMGSSSMCARISGILAPFVGGPLGDVWEPLPVLIFGLFGGLSGFLTFFLPETLGCKMPETIADAEYVNKKKDIALNGTVDSRGFSALPEVLDVHGSDFTKL